MSGLHNLNKRVQYYGGHTEQRMIKDKLRSLRYALNNSYQAETLVLNDNREFKCLINPDKLHTDYDNKILSIPFQGECLNPEVSTYSQTAEGYEDINLKAGDVFTWKETQTHWLIYLRYLEENAYLRADIRKCNKQLEINGRTYWVYLRGPVETSIPWNQKGGIEWNDLNFSLVMFITKDDNTMSYLKRFSKIKLTDPVTHKKNTWQVVGHNSEYGDGIIRVFLDEYYENSLQDLADAEDAQKPNPEEHIDKSKPYIKGPSIAHKYDTITFLANQFTEQGKWIVKYNDMTILNNVTDYKLKFTVAKSKGQYTVEYRTEHESAQWTVDIAAL